MPSGEVKMRLAAISLTILVVVALILGYTGIFAWRNVTIVLMVVILVTLILGYVQVLKWTGMTGKTDEFQTRTLWDWLQLLIVPAVLALGGLWFAAQQDIRQQRMDNRRERIIQGVENQRAQDSMLLSYLDQMSSLLIDEKLQTSQPGEPERLVAAARTITVLRGLDPERKRTVLRFVYEAGLIRKEEIIVNLDGANLTEADLNNVPLENADLSDLYLSDANLAGADLSGADLSGTDLSGAEVTWQQLRTCASLTGTTLPEELKHKNKGDQQ